MESQIPASLLSKDDTDEAKLMNELRTKAYGIAMSGPVKSLLGLARDAKTKKSLDKKNVLTGVLYLASGNVSGTNICPMMTVGCGEGCLFTAGHGTYTQIKVGRLRKTYQFLFRREEFMERLVKDIQFLLRKAERDENIPAVRLNGTSDIAWETMPCVVDGKKYNNLFEAFPDLQFYDYTKIRPRLEYVLKIPNYHITFSYAETKANRKHAEEAIKLGVNVAVVFDKLPDTFTIGEFKDMPVINGDETDVRFWDSDEKTIVGLTWKGKARKDNTGFVIRLADISQEED